MTKQLLIFMTHQDEATFSEILRSNFPGIVFLDGNVWPHPEPAIARSIDQCKSDYGDVYLWNKDLFPAIPIGPRAGGGFQGPGSGPVLQFLRSIPEENILRSGRIALGISDENLTPEVDAYFKAVWRIVKKHATSALVSVD